MADLLDCNNINLKYGSKGEQVTKLQKNLQTLGYYLKSGNSTLKCDGDYGNYTVEAVKQFQKSCGTLLVDGIFGPYTCKKFNEKLEAKEKEQKKADEKKNADNKTTKAEPTPAELYPVGKYYRRNQYYWIPANVVIEGVYFDASVITPTTVYRQNWKTIELKDGTNYMYKGHPSPREYTIETILNPQRFYLLSRDLYNMNERPCRVLFKNEGQLGRIANELYKSGNYVIKVSVVKEKLTHYKVTFKLTEYMVGVA